MDPEFGRGGGPGPLGVPPPSSGGPMATPPPSDGGGMASMISAPPEGWQSNRQAYADAGLGNGWIATTAGGAGFGGAGHDWMENPDAYARTQQGSQMPYGIDPFSDIVYSPGANGESGFRYGGNTGPDIFGGRNFGTDNFPRDIPKLLPREAQSWLAPSLMRYFYQNNYVSQNGSGIKAPWTQQFAPTAPKLEHPTWSSIATYDPWHRDLGSYANLFS